MISDPEYKYWILESNAFGYKYQIDNIPAVSYIESVSWNKFPSLPSTIHIKLNAIKNLCAIMVDATLIWTIL